MHNSARKIMRYMKAPEVKRAVCALAAGLLSIFICVGVAPPQNERGERRATRSTGRYGRSRATLRDYSALAGLIGSAPAGAADATEGADIDIDASELEALNSVLDAMAADFSVEGALASVWKAYRDTPQDFDGYSPVTPEGEAAFYRHLRLPQLHGRAGAFHLPAAGRLTSPFGYRPRFRRMHRGVDIAVGIGDTIRAAYDGVVAYRGREPRGYGNYMVITHAGGIETLYGHLLNFIAESGQAVRAGEAIALGGNSGRSTGPHLHFETRYRGMAVDPFEVEPALATALGGSAVRTASIPGTLARPAALQHRVAPKALPDAAESLPRTYTARRGDSPASIARRFRVPIEALCRLNSIVPNQLLYSGQILKLR